MTAFGHTHIFERKGTDGTERFYERFRSNAAAMRSFVARVRLHPESRWLLWTVGPDGWVSKRPLLDSTAPEVDGE